VDGDELRVTVSGGISQHRLDEANIEDIIKRADEALYIAKNSGRNQIVVR
jgi:diguanylate cyclase (GGDEF)-like protein